jgi:hypothetical protein
MAMTLRFECAQGHILADYYKMQEHLRQRGCGSKKAHEHARNNEKTGSGKKR